MRLVIADHARLRVELRAESLRRQGVERPAQRAVVPALVARHRARERVREEQVGAPPLGDEEPVERPPRRAQLLAEEERREGPLELLLTPVLRVDDRVAREDHRAVTARVGRPQVYGRETLELTRVPVVQEDDPPLLGEVTLEAAAVGAVVCALEEREGRAARGRVERG